MVSRRELLSLSLFGILPETATMAAEDRELLEFLTDAPQRPDEDDRTKTLRDALKRLADIVAFQARTSPPVGTVVAFAGSTAPECWLICDGSIIDASQNPEHRQLAEMIGKTYDPEHKVVRLPNLQGRVIIGVGKGAGLTSRTIGNVGGEETHALSVVEMPQHAHGVNDPGHGHLLELGRTGKRYSGGGSAALDDDFRQGADARKPPPPFLAKTEATGITIQNNGSSTPHNNMQPFCCTNYIIKYK